MRLAKILTTKRGVSHTPAPSLHATVSHMRHTSYGVTVAVKKSALRVKRSQYAVRRDTLTCKWERTSSQLSRNYRRRALSFKHVG